MSIRITSSGHNFSHDNLTLSPEQVATLIIESPKAMLLPTVLLGEMSIEEHLLSAGIAIQNRVERVIVIEHDKVTTALIVIPIPLLEEIKATYGERVIFSSPLLARAPSNGHEVIVHLSEDHTLLSLNLFNGGDRLFAELFEIKSSTDVLYWLTRIGEGYDLSSYTIYVDGGDRELVKLLKGYYKKIEICE